jgi:hypothetical protein
VVSLLVERAGLHADIFVADSQIRYLAPLFADLDVSAEPARNPIRTNSSPPLRSRGRARIGLGGAHAPADGWRPPPISTARYVAIRK